MSEDTIRDDILSRGTGSFTVHGKKASVITFGTDLQSMSPDEHMRQRKQSQLDEQVQSPASIDDDFHSILAQPFPAKERRESAASASTATARSFRELHRKYSSAQNVHRNATGGLVVPSDDDSDAAISFSDGRRTPLPPLEDESGDEVETSLRAAMPKQAHFFTPEPPGSPADDEPNDETARRNEVDRLPSPPIQIVSV
jgi:hypothetical protein